LWSKSIAAGLLITAAILLSLLDPSMVLDSGSLLTIAAPLAAMGFLGITTNLLISDLHRPNHFYYILTKPLLVWRGVGRSTDTGVLLAAASRQYAPNLALYAIGAMLPLAGAYVLDELWITAGRRCR
jgi:hypothetical protein